MKKIRRGFTLIEVTLFLAISGLLFIGIVGGVQTSLQQQQDNDSLQSFQEFLRGVYSQVSNTQIPGAKKGNSEKAVYGKLVTFGEDYQLYTGRNEGNRTIFVYTVVGDVMEELSTNNTVNLLNALHADVVYTDEDGKVQYYGNVESYEPRWGAEVQPKCANVEEGKCDRSLEGVYKGSILIVRHPATGVVTTLVADGEEGVINMRSDDHGHIDANAFKNKLTKERSDGTGLLFRMEQLDLCFNVSRNVRTNDKRYNLRLMVDIHNGSGIELIPDGNAEGVKGGSNQCKKA